MIPPKLYTFTLISFPLRYLVENILQMWVTLVVEINLLIGSYTLDYFKRDLTQRNTLIAMTSVSGLILLIHMIAVLTIIVIAVKSIQRKDKYVPNQLKTSTPLKLVTFVKGLNT